MLIGIDELFAEEEDESELELSLDHKRHSGDFVRCICGQLFNSSIPSICVCGRHKPYWQMIDGKTKRLSQMDLGHLTNVVKMLAAKVERAESAEYRTNLETAIDLVYLEIGRRDKEITQMAGIGRALTKALSAD